MTSPEPFLRWAGGKRQMVPVLLPALPKDFDLSKNRFFEPFVGGGAVSFALASDSASANLVATKRKTGRPLVLNDVNGDLINTYRVIQNDVDELIKLLVKLEKNTSKAAYYKARDRVPEDPIEQAARIVFLNKLSFNGLHRVRGDGKFNVPYGQVAKSSIYSDSVLRACSAWLSHAELRSGNYTAAVSDAVAGDVVYLDPPYIPLTVTASFSKYAKDDFKELDQWALRGVIDGLISRGVRVLFSNSNTDLTRLIFGKTLTLYAVSAQRSIGASSASRIKVQEVLGISYSPTEVRDPKSLKNLQKLTTKAKG